MVRDLLRLAIRRPLATAIVIAIAARLATFVFAFYVPITNEIGMPVSPSLLQPWIEFEFYRKSLEAYRTLSLSELYGLFVEYYQRPFADADGHIIGGPVFPALIGVFDYRAGNTLPLALVYLFFSSSLAAIWLIWLRRNNVGAIWLWVFALLPNPFWFMLNVTTDLAFAVLVTLFYLTYFRDRWAIRHVAAWVVLLVLCVLVRPNGAAILLFVFLDFALFSSLSIRLRLTVVGILGVAGLASAAYLFPYFATEMSKLTSFEYFGHDETQYLEGLFAHLPIWIDLLISWVSLLAAKSAYFTGLRPSSAGIAAPWLILRAAAGVILLPGLIYALFYSVKRERLFVWVYIFPIFLSSTQDRYNLAIQPLLFLYGIQAYRVLWLKLRRDHPTPPRATLDQT